MNVFDKLQNLAYNLRWDWHPGTRTLFRDLDPHLWEEHEQNPVALLRRLDPARLEGVPGLGERVDTLWQDLQSYLAAEESWYGANHEERPLVAYFCAEYGLTESLKIYSGGLGVLAGDHLKSASDLGVPLVAVGLLYREGYFNQAVDPAGRQREAYPRTTFEDLPVRGAEDGAGRPVRVAVAFPGRAVHLRVWRVDVGRVPLFLLDADLPENGEEDRHLTARLYGGDQETRISQELLLGIGGYRALQALGVAPRSFHMNEGHSAFLGLELVREVMAAEGVDLDDAVQRVRPRIVFTTHTPVPAGHDRFPPALVRTYLGDTAHAMGVHMDDLLDLGRVHPNRPDELFTMTVLALRLAEQVNGVSRLHGQVTREMWHELWPDREIEDVPIAHITNGVHLATWVHPDVAATFGTELDRLGVTGDAPAPDSRRLWQVRNHLRHRLIDFVRHRVGARLDPDALTIAFARRFATYKRATLLLADLDRLERLLGREDRPVQVLFSGKAHPQDEGGKALIRRIVEVSHLEPFHDRIVFLPGYGLGLAHRLVQGADVWLNNPRRPMEASGTSGMKAAANGVLNVSILDGWWEEAWQATEAPVGWAVTPVDREAMAYPEERDAADQEALFRVLEEEVVPAFFDRDAGGVPVGWTERMAASIRELAPTFSTHRMVRDYTKRYRRAAQPEPASPRF
jgi:glycogen phosphorylase